jgi:asparagine synthase (glutamine-hydrolysing)
MLSHRRLSILDLSAAGAQPMVDAPSGQVVVVNGEIYNFAELRKALSADGHVVQSSGDTVVMLRLLAAYGPDSIRRLRGMFAFALWNPTTREVTLARDPLGIKPLYLARNPNAGGTWSLAFASEVRALLASGLQGKPLLDPRAAASVVWSGFMVTPDTAIAGVESVWPGQVRVFSCDGQQVSASRYWSLPSPSVDSPSDEGEVSLSFAESVRRHLVSDVPLCVFLSGGVDSAAVANLAMKHASGPVHSFTLAFEEKAYNEGLVARQVAKEIGTSHQEMVLTEAYFIEQLDAALDSIDQPTFDGINSYYMARAVRDSGFKVALAGTGGDELFGGYTSFRDLPRMLQANSAAKWFPDSAVQALAGFASAILQPSNSGVPQQTRWAKLPEMLKPGNDMLSLYQIAYALFLPDFRRQLLSGTAHEMMVDGLPAEMHALVAANNVDRSALSSIGAMEQSLFLGERLLRDTDVASMAASIEVRLPLVDQDFLESVYRLPDKLRFLPIGKKAILRRIGLQGLDPTLFERKKAGFVLPFALWLRRNLGKVMDKTMRDPEAVKSTGLNPDAVRRLWEAFLGNAPGIYWSRVWAIYVLIRWCQRNHVGI